MEQFPAFPDGSHSVQFYQDEPYLLEKVSSYLADGLRRGHAAVGILVAHRIQPITEKLRSLEIDLDEALASGRLHLLDASETLEKLTVNGAFDQKLFLDVIGGKIDSLMEKFGQVHAYGEMVVLLLARGDSAGTLDLERQWSAIVDQLGFSLMCGYSLGAFPNVSDSYIFKDICATHSFTLPTEDYSSLTTTEEQRRAIAALQQKAHILEKQLEARDVSEKDLKRKTEELKKQARALERSNEELKTFAYVASHDLKEPLRMVRIYVQLLERGFTGTMNPETAEYLRFATQGAARMQELIDDLLTYSAVDNRPGEMADVDMNELLRDVKTDLSLKISETNAVITQTELPTVFGDRTQLRQLAQNLLSNAIKFTRGKQPVIHIAAAECSGGFHFSVEDNGIGIEPEYFDKVFVLFQRLHARDLFPGTGLGLAICKKIVDRHGGRIWVESKMGEGSTFHFTVPSTIENYLLFSNTAEE